MFKIHLNLHGNFYFDKNCKNIEELHKGRNNHVFKIELNLNFNNLVLYNSIYIFIICNNNFKFFYLLITNFFNLFVISRTVYKFIEKIGYKMLYDSFI